jgi:hypothetical protein
MRQNSRPEPPAKPKGTPINAKALNAWHSELRAYERRLVQWEADLEMRECDLDTAISQNWAEDCDPYCEDDIDMEDGACCECTQKDALAGCDCETCECWRSSHKATVAYERSAAKPWNEAGDEVQFLERLFELKDKRK